MLFEKQYDALKTQKNNNKEAKAYIILFKNEKQKKKHKENNRKNRDTVDEYLKNKNIAEAQ